MDYEQMSVQELRAECQARGLGTARSRADLIQRLTGHDAEHSQPQGGLVETSSPDDDTVPAPISSPESVLPAHAVPRVFRMEFPAEREGPDEETHFSCRQTTIHAAAEAGFRVRGDARLAETRNGQWVYEVSVRPGEPS